MSLKSSLLWCCLVNLMSMSFSSSKESEYITFVLPIASASKTNIEYYLKYAHFLTKYEA